ncbi:sulfite exporter TauE/SafE family protein [Parasalinivibrio latis]|uniref:sulfite exporter TauE/SafE family protein n=1 Tax=Parasalinivibrio latis TaxID=2952610 RepID=UPI0030DE7796
MEVFVSEAAAFFSDDLLFYKLVFGVIFGALLVLTGVGGGVLLIPVLQVGFGMSAVVAVGTASLIATLVKAQAAFTHVANKNVEWPAIRWLLLSAIPLALITSQAIVQLNTSVSFVTHINAAVEWLIIIVMVAALLSLTRDRRRREKTAVKKSSSQYRTNSICSGAVGGVLLGSTGIGGGVVLLPLLSGPIGVDVRKAIGSSVVISLCLSMVTAISFNAKSLNDLPTAGLIVFGSLAGTVAASKIMKKLSNKQLYTLTTLVLLISLAIQLSTQL